MGGNGVVVFEIGTWRMASWTWRVREGDAFDDGFPFSGMVKGKVKDLQVWLGWILASVLLLYDSFCVLHIAF